MASHLILRLTMAALLCVGCLSSSVSAQSEIYWTGEGNDNLWDNPANWLDEIVPSAAERAIINGPEAEGENGPLIQEGIEAVTEILISDGGLSNVTMTGGSLELTGWGMWWGDAAGTTATFEMSGGVVDLTGSPGIMELGWQEQTDPPGSSVGIWNMTGGEVFAKGVDMPGKNYGGVGVINLHGGTLNVGLERGGLMLYEGAQLDITEGLLILEGDQTSVVEDYIELGYMTAFGGDGDFNLSFDGDYTTVAASSSTLPGDLNGDGTIDAADIDTLTRDCLLGNSPTCATMDLTGDGAVNAEDHHELVTVILNTYIGDANLDLEFNSSDLVAVLASGTYENDVDSTWATGDFNGDGRTNSSDLVAALADGGYELGPKPAAGAVAAVPEPNSIALVLSAMLVISLRTRSPSRRS
jgi:hypothetical protein